jgi:N-formylglutamate amidohydrolase
MAIEGMATERMEPFLFRERSGPLLVSMPHVGLHIPDDIAAGMTDLALMVSDTDWHIDRLYDFLDDLGASVVAATHSRYVVDLNRPPDGASLYPGKATPSRYTEKVPRPMRWRSSIASPSTGNPITADWKPSCGA